MRFVKGEMPWVGRIRDRCTIFAAASSGHASHTKDFSTRLEQRGGIKGGEKNFEKKTDTFPPIRLLGNDRFFSSPFEGLNYILFTRGAINISTYLISNFLHRKKIMRGMDIS